MPDYSLYGYGFVTPTAFKNKTGFNFYSQISIKSNLNKKDIENKWCFVENYSFTISWGK